MVVAENYSQQIVQASFVIDLKNKKNSLLSKSTVFFHPWNFVHPTEKYFIPPMYVQYKCEELNLPFHCLNKKEKSSSASTSRPDSFSKLLLWCRAPFNHFLFKFLPQFGKAGSPARLLFPAEPHEGVNISRAFLWSLHTIASLHLLLHLLQRLQRTEWIG